MYTHFGKRLAVAVSSLSLLALGGYVHAEEAAKAEPAKAEQTAPAAGPTNQGTADAATGGNKQPQQQQAQSQIKWPEPPPGYYPPQRQQTRSAQAPTQQSQTPSHPAPRPYGPPPASAQRGQPQQMQQAPRSYGPPPGYYPGRSYGPQQGYYPGYYGGYQPYPSRRRSSNSFMPWGGDWSSDDMIPFSSNRGDRRMPWQGWNKDQQPWNKDDNWDKMPWNWNIDNAPWNNWSGDGRMKDGSKYYKDRNKKKANVSWD